MDTSPSFEEFSRTYSKRIPQLFSRLDLNSRIEVDKVYNLTILVRNELILAQEELLKIQSEDQIKETYLIFCYFAYLYYLDSKGERDIDEYWDNYSLFDDFLLVVLSHIVLNRDEKKIYADQYSSNSDFVIASDRSNKFTKLLRETGFNFEKSTFAVIFAILIWVKLEKILKIHEANLKIIRIENRTIYHLTSDDLVTSASAQHQVTSLLIDCVKCYYLFERYDKMIKYGNSEAGKIFKSKVRKETSKKGGKNKGEAGQKLVEITRFFWKKCNKKKLKIAHLTMENFSDAIYSLCDKRRKVPNGAIKKIRDAIENLNEKEKIAILKRSKAKPKAIAARLSGFKK